MLLQSYFPFPVLNRKTIFSKNFSNFLRLLLAFTKIFVFNNGQITEGEKYSFRGDEFSVRLHCFKKHVLSTKEQQRETFSMVKLKEYAKHEISSIQVLLFVSVCIVVFLTSIFLFRGLSIISSVRYFFVEVYQFKNICQMEIFVIVYLPKKCLLNNYFLSLCEV